MRSFHSGILIKMAESKVGRVAFKSVAVTQLLLFFNGFYGCKTREQAAIELQWARIDTLEARFERLDQNKIWQYGLQLKFGRLQEIRAVLQDWRQEDRPCPLSASDLDNRADAFERLLGSVQKTMHAQDSLGMLAASDAAIVQSRVDSLRIYDPINYACWVKGQQRLLGRIEAQMRGFDRRIAAPAALRAGLLLLRLSNNLDSIFTQNLSVVKELRHAGLQLRDSKIRPKNWSELKAKADSVLNY